MPIKVLVPSLGEGVEEVTVSKWLKHEGDSVKQFEPLLEVNTDKVDTEIGGEGGGGIGNHLVNGLFNGFTDWNGFVSG